MAKLHSRKRLPIVETGSGPQQQSSTLKEMTMEGDNREQLARDLTEALAEAIQVRLLFTAFREAIPQGQITAYLAVEQRVLDLEILLLQLAGDYQMFKKATSEPMAHGRRLH